MVEYAIMLAFIAAVAFAVVVTLGLGIQGLFQTTSDLWESVTP